MTEHGQQGPAVGRDRRSFFRIDDNVRLSVRKIPAEELDQRLERLDLDLAGNFTVMSSLSAITAHMSANLRRIENRDADLAAYLRAIDQKIEVIGRAFIAQEPEAVGQHAVSANLSAGGMCVGVDETLERGDAVELRMLLFPSFTGLMIYGTVVSEEPAENDEAAGGKPYLLRVEFTHIREQDRELLIKHLLRRQSGLLREEREERE